MKNQVCELANNKCIPCRGGTPPLPKNAANSLLVKLASGWSINKAGHLYKEYKFSDFVSAMKFANRVTEIAEQEGHHPDLHIAWGLCACEIWTHKINGLSESDFFLAAKIELLIQPKE